MTVAGPFPRKASRGFMAKKKQAEAKTPAEEPVEEAGLREKIEIYLFLAVEVLCLLLFIDFLFIGYYVK